MILSALQTVWYLLAVALFIYLVREYGRNKMNGRMSAWYSVKNGKVSELSPGLAQTQVGQWLDIENQQDAEWLGISLMKLADKYGMRNHLPTLNYRVQGDCDMTPDEVYNGVVIIEVE